MSRVDPMPDGDKTPAEVPLVVPDDVLPGDVAEESTPPPAPASAAAAGHAAQRSGRSARRRPCIHCGKLTPVRVLEKTGDLCWRCSQPVGYTFAKNLITLSVLLVLVAGGIFAWRYWRVDPNAPAAKPQASEPEEPAARRFTLEDRVVILRRHLLDGVPASEIVAEYKLDTATLNRWKEQFFQNAQAALERSEQHEPTPIERRIQGLEQKVQTVSKMLGELHDGLGQLKRDTAQYEASATQRFILDSAGPPPK